MAAATRRGSRAGEERWWTVGEYDVAVLAGTVSTTLFVVSYLPMLVKAFRTRDLTSYSLGNLAIANVGNAVHSIYVFSLPAGPIWFLHGFYLASTAVMLVWHRRYARRGPAGTLETSAEAGAARPTLGA